MKIVYASDAYYPRTHGVAVSIDASIDYFANEEHEIHVIAPEYEQKDERKLHKNITIHRYKSYSLFFTTNKEERFIYPSEIKKIHSDLDKIDADIVHIHLEFFIGYAARKWAVKNNKVLIITAHTFYPPYLKLYIPYMPMSICYYITKKYSKWFYDKADILITPSKEMADILKKEYKVTTKIEHHLFGIDAKKFKIFDKTKITNESKLIEKYPRIKNRKKLLFVGRIGEEKNVSFLLKMMKALLAKRDDVELILVGTGSYIEKFKKKIKKMKIDSHVTFLGVMAHTQIHEAYAIGDVFVFSSVTETQGLVTGEALYFGLPVVAVAALGTISVLQNNRGGFLVEEDKYKFAEKVELLLDNEELYKEKKEEALERGKELVFSNTGEYLIKIYLNAFAQKYGYPIYAD